jgi:hypothetical protein
MHKKEVWAESVVRLTHLVTDGQRDEREKKML